MFSATGMQGFKMFSTVHIVTLVLFFAACGALVYFRNQQKRYQLVIKWSLFILLPTCEISLQLWLILTQQWAVSNLPLQLCSISSFLAMFLFLKRNKKVFYLLYFFGTLTPILAMVTPEMTYNFPHFRYIEYFLHHSVIPLAAFYFILFEDYRVPMKAMISSFLTVNLIAVPIFFLNLLLGTNFFYLASPTEAKTILTFFGNGIMYYINLEIAALIVFFITYLPIGILQRIENKKSVSVKQN
ncbi:TIGR02206 family membrane protein [Bacillus sp. AFS073361]|uniref:YwaF family protein n=1 Tax=Bacillus sp. AFS073361 TaxID=2033511 RepID=UPI000BF923CF|nr:TIGR02206 family membrane protein [Bacillus sp. AFS073361]PFP27615.1 TIGR02206 family membrane protein [Bacillus sp. AFS073361]